MSRGVNYISSTLLNAWLYHTLKECGNYEEFLNVLNRVKTPQTPAQALGCEFENKVYNGEIECYNEYVKGGFYQVKVKRFYKNILLLGIIDVLQPDCIYDVKTTSRYEIGKYYNTSQHKVYCYCTGIRHFAYLINEECYKEDYYYKNGECEELVDSFLDWLKITNLYDIWKEKWRKMEW